MGVAPSLMGTHAHRCYEVGRAVIVCLDNGTLPLARLKLAAARNIGVDASLRVGFFCDKAVTWRQGGKGDRLRA